MYRNLVAKKKTESQSFSIGEPTEDATYNRDELPSYEEPPHHGEKRLDPPSLGARKKEIKLSPMKPKNSDNPSDISPKLSKQRSEERPSSNIFTKRIGLQMFNSFDDKKELNYEKHPRNFDRNEFSLSGTSSKLLKSNIRKQSLTPSESKSMTSPEPPLPRSILRERSFLENSKSLEFDKSAGDKSEKEDDDKKSVRFNLDTNADITFDFSEKSGSDDESKYNKNSSNEVINVKVIQNKPKSRFTISPVDESFLHQNNTHVNEGNSLKLIKPNPTDFIKPTLKITSSLDNYNLLPTSESDDDSVLKNVPTRENTITKTQSETIFEHNLLDPIIRTSPKQMRIINNQREKVRSRIENEIETLKTELWEQKNAEMEHYRECLQKSHKQELQRILFAEKTSLEEKIKLELENLRFEMETRSTGTLNDERDLLEDELEDRKMKLHANFENEKKEILKQQAASFEKEKQEIQKRHENKLLELEKELDVRYELNRTQLITDHNATLEQLKENHSVIIDNLKREFVVEVIVSYCF